MSSPLITSTSQAELRQLTRGAVFMDDLSSVDSKTRRASDGLPSATWVAVKQGVNVCWCCGEPFGHETDPQLALVEKLCENPELNSGAYIGVHRKCAIEQRRSFWDMGSVARAAERAGGRAAKKVLGAMGIR